MLIINRKYKNIHLNELDHFLRYKGKIFTMMFGIDNLAIALTPSLPGPRIALVIG